MIFVGNLICKIGSALSSIINLFPILVDWYLLTPVIALVLAPPALWQTRALTPASLHFSFGALGFSLLRFILRVLLLCLWFDEFLVEFVITLSIHPLFAVWIRFGSKLEQTGCSSLWYGCRLFQILSFNCSVPIAGWNFGFAPTIFLNSARLLSKVSRSSMF